MLAGTPQDGREEHAWCTSGTGGGPYREMYQPTMWRRSNMGLRGALLASVCRKGGMEGGPWASVGVSRPRYAITRRGDTWAPGPSLGFVITGRGEEERGGL